MVNHDERTQALAEEFRASIGERALILVPQFPFLFIGIILDVVADQVILDVETTHIEQIENQTWQVHLDTIQAFYIKGDGYPGIPNL